MRIRESQAQPLDRITEADIQSLIDNAVPEGRDIEYKRSVPGTTDAEKHEFLSDVSSFANVSGGLMIFGVGENRGSRDRSSRPSPQRTLTHRYCR